MQRSLGALLLVAACGVSDAFSLPPSMVRMSARINSASAGQFASRPALALSKTATPRPLLRVTGAGVELRMGVLSDILVRKTKDVEALKSSLTDGAKELLEKGITGKHKHRYLKAVKKPLGTVSVQMQMKYKQPGLVTTRGTDAFAGIPQCDMLAGHAYEAGASAVAVCTDKEVYGLDVDSIKMVVKSQRCNKGKYPGPLPVLAYDFFLDPCQLAHVADAGAEAVNLNVAALGEKTKHMLEEAERMGLDAVVQVHNEAELAIAIAAGASIIGVVNRDMETFLPQNEMDGVSRLWIEPFEQTVFGRLIPLIPDGIVKVASGAVNETLAAWTLRDKGYTSILVGEAVIKGSESQMAGSSYQGAYNEGKGLMIAYRSKGSLKYGPSSTASFYGKGEGAKETLGMMSI